MPVDKVELAKDLATPEYQKIVTEELGKQKFFIKDEAGHKAYEEEFKGRVIKEDFGKMIKEVHDKYDGDLKTVFGEDYKRNENESTYDALKRVGSAKLNALVTEREVLKKQIAEGDKTGATAKLLADAEAKYQTELTARDAKIKELEKTGESKEKAILLRDAYAPIKASFVKQLPAMFTEFEKSIIDQETANSYVKDGVLYSNDKDSSFNPIKIEDRLKLRFKDVINTNQPKPGAGSSGSGAGDKGVDPSKITLESFVIGDGVKTPQDLTGQLIGLGIPRGGDVYRAIWDKFVDSKNGVLKTA